jgi:uncharacterized sulfatase
MLTRPGPRAACRAVVACCLLAPLACARGPAAETPPNLVILFADDLGYGDLGAYGHPSIRTPSLDRLAREGQRWTDFYAGATVCSPSRAALLTGRLPVRSGLYGDLLGVYFENEPWGLPAAEVTLAEALREVGYISAIFGKWHLGDQPDAWPTRHGFDRWLGLPHSNDMNWTVGLDFAATLEASRQQRSADLERDRRVKRDAYFDPRHGYWNVPLLRSERAEDGERAADGTTEGFVDEVVERPARQETVTRRLTEAAVAMLREQAAGARGRPFFAYVAYSMPHIPLFRSEEFAGHSLAGRYGDVIEEIDWSVGEIVGALEETGLAANTLVVFTSDNGPWLDVAGGPNPDAGFAGVLTGGKGTTFEGGVRVPAIFWWPGTIAPGVTSEIGAGMDLFTTALALAGAPLPRDRTLDGLDLTPVLRRADAPPRRADAEGPRTSYPYYRGGELQAWRSGRYKLRFVTEGAYGAPPARTEHDPPQLFDLGEDPAELFDLAASRPEIAARLVAEARAHRDGLPKEPPLFDRRLAETPPPH